MWNTEALRCFTVIIDLEQRGTFEGHLWDTYFAHKEDVAHMILPRVTQLVAELLPDGSQVYKPKALVMLNVHESKSSLLVKSNSVSSTFYFHYNSPSLDFILYDLKFSFS